MAAWGPYLHRRALHPVRQVGRGRFLPECLECRGLSRQGRDNQETVTAAHDRLLPSEATLHVGQELGENVEARLGSNPDSETHRTVGGTAGARWLPDAG